MPVRGRVLVWLFGTAALFVPFAFFAAARLDDFRPVSDDEALIMSASFKLASEGVLGSDLYTGLFNGERHYYFNLPAQHLLQAAWFKVAGPGVAQARGASFGATVLLVGAASWLAFRWYGLVAAWLTTVLLVYWRSDLVSLHPGLPLLGVARSARYDVGAVAWMWVSLVLVDRLVRRPHWLTASLVGLSAGIAALTQFFGVLVVPAIAAIARRHRRIAASRGLAGCIVAGFGMVVVPYVAFVAADVEDWIGQNITIRDPARIRLDSPMFYLDNLAREPGRFAHLTSATFSSWLLLLGVGPAVGWVAVKARRRESIGDQILIAALATSSAGLALFDSTKAALYAVVLLPPVCIAIGSLIAQLTTWGTTMRSRQTRWAAVTVATLLVTLLAFDGLRAFRLDRQEAREASAYLEVGARIRSLLPERTTIVGPHRWWWALHDYHYLSHDTIWWQWRLASAGSGPTPEFADFIANTGARYLIVNGDVRATIERFPESLQQQFRRFLEGNCSRVAAWRDHSYSEIELYRVDTR